MSTGKGLLWTGRILSIVFVLFMIMDGVMKIVRPPSVVEGSAKMGYAASTLPGIGVALLLCTLLYVVPKTRVLGGLLLTGYLGGAVASQVRVGATAFELAFPILFAVVLWASLWIVEPRLRALIPVESN